MGSVYVSVLFTDFAEKDFHYVTSCGLIGSGVREDLKLIQDLISGRFLMRIIS